MTLADEVKEAVNVIRDFDPEQLGPEGVEALTRIGDLITDPEKGPDNFAAMFTTVATTVGLDPGAGERLRKLESDIKVFLQGVQGEEKRRG